MNIDQFEQIRGNVLMYGTAEEILMFDEYMKNNYPDVKPKKLNNDDLYLIWKNRKNKDDGLFSVDYILNEEKNYKDAEEVRKYANRRTGNLPNDEEDAKKQGFKVEKYDLFHRFNDDNVSKYINDSGREVVYNNGKLLAEDNIDRGTYNFGTGFKDHYLRDVKPFLENELNTENTGRLAKNLINSGVKALNNKVNNYALNYPYNNPQAGDSAYISTKIDNSPSGVQSDSHDPDFTYQNSTEKQKLKALNQPAGNEPLYLQKNNPQSEGDGFISLGKDKFGLPSQNSTENSKPLEYIMNPQKFMKNSGLESMKSLLPDNDNFTFAYDKVSKNPRALADYKIGGTINEAIKMIYGNQGSADFNNAIRQLNEEDKIIRRIKGKLSSKR